MARRTKGEIAEPYTKPLTETDPALESVLHHLLGIHERHTLLLTERQLNVLDCFLSGMPYTKIALESRMSVDAVRTALRDIATLLGCDIADIKAVCSTRGYHAER